MFPSVASSGLPLHANETGEPLFLSPYLAKGQWKLGQKKARVDGAQFGKAAAGVESYAGYLTVNAEDCKSNLFFWYFPAVVSFLLSTSEARRQLYSGANHPPPTIS